MPSDSGDMRPPRAQNNVGPHLPSKLTGQLPCPRCQSTNTKFCYYNNYNLSQPRHFCKACRRYWTQGGTLRNVPVGGGTRKNSKRARSSSSTSTYSSTTAAATSSTTSTCTLTRETDVLRLPSDPDPTLPVLKADTDNSNLNHHIPGTENGNFISLLSAQQGPGFMGMVGYESSFGYEFSNMGLEHGGRGAWEYTGMGYIGSGNGGNLTWTVEGGSEETGGLVDGDCFSWPGLAIPGEGNSIK